MLNKRTSSIGRVWRTCCI